MHTLTKIASSFGFDFVYLEPALRHAMTKYGCGALAGWVRTEPTAWRETVNVPIPDA